MNRLFLGFAAMVTVIVGGCSSKSSTPSGPAQPKPIRIVVAPGASAPSTTDVNSAVWNTVTATAVSIQDTTPVKLSSIVGVSGLADSVHLKAIKFNDTLYLQVTWHDATHDIWPERIDVVGCPGNPSNACFVSQAGGVFEDRLLVLFGGLSGAQWDVLDWRALTTGAGFLAMGGIYHRDTVSGVPHDTIVADAETNSLTPALANWDINFGPVKMRYDSSLFQGALLYLTDAVDMRQLAHWSAGQTLPGFIIDTSLVTKTPDTRGSRWDTRAADIWDTTSGTYTLVLTRPMNTGFTDDVDLTAVDSVATQVAVFDNQTSFTRGNHMGFTLPFWLVLR